MTSPISTDHKGDLLVVDDDLPSLRALSNLLSEHGYQVRSARNGPSALMMARAEPPDLILLDIQMPEMDGFQVCAALKASPATRDIPVLFISAGDDVLDKVKSFEVGGVDYINKPFREEEALARIHTHLTLARLNGQLRTANTRLLAEIYERERVAERLRVRLNEFSALHRIAQTLTATHALPQALEAVSRTICELFGARLTLIALHGSDPMDLHALAGYEQGRGAISLAPADSSLPGLPSIQAPLAPGEWHVFNSPDAASLAEPVRAFVRTASLQSGLVVPLISRGAGLGILLVGKDDDKASFSQFEIDLVETIAMDIGAAIENDRLAVQARLAAVDAERQRLARELHDSVTQSIYSLTLLSSGWESMARQGTLQDPADSFRRLGEVGQQALREMRLLLHQLRPSTLEEQGLVKALEQRLDRVELRANIEARVTASGSFDDLPQKVEDELFNIAQEALNNSLRHARAGHVQVLLAAEQDRVMLTVEDDGHGFNPDAGRAGMGLGNMQERVQAVAGTLTIQSKPGGGTRVAVSVPIRKSAEEP